MVTKTESYLCESVLVQKVWIKPGAYSAGERSQCLSTMTFSEEADPHYSEGWQIDLVDVRASALMAKHVSSASAAFPERSIRLPFLASRVPDAVIPRKWRLLFTSEVLNRLCLPQSKRGP
jgi:hypothetical protein